MKKFTKQENQTLSEIYRRLHAFHKVNGKCTLDNQLVLLSLPSIAKGLIKLDIIKPSCGEIPRVSNWYKLTPKGKKLFTPYVNDNPSESELLSLFENRTYKEFTYPTD